MRKIPLVCPQCQREISDVAHWYVAADRRIVHQRCYQTYQRGLRTWRNTASGRQLLDAITTYGPHAEVSMVIAAQRGVRQ